MKKSILLILVLLSGSFPYGNALEITVSWPSEPLRNERYFIVFSVSSGTFTISYETGETFEVNVETYDQKIWLNLPNNHSQVGQVQVTINSSDWMVTQTLSWDLSQSLTEYPKEMNMTIKLGSYWIGTETVIFSVNGSKYHARNIIDSDFSANEWLWNNSFDISGEAPKELMKNLFGNDTDFMRFQTLEYIPTIITADGYWEYEEWNFRWDNASLDLKHSVSMGDRTWGAFTMNHEKLEDVRSTVLGFIDNEMKSSEETTLGNSTTSEEKETITLVHYPSEDITPISFFASIVAIMVLLQKRKAIPLFKAI